MSNEPDSPSNPFSDYHSTNAPINIGTSIKERSNFFEQQAQKNSQNNLLKSPSLRQPLRSSPKLKQPPPLSLTNSNNEARANYLNNIRNNNSTVYSNNTSNSPKVIVDPFSDSNKIAPSPSDDGSPTVSKFLDPNSSQKNTLNKPPSPLIPSKPLALRTSPRVKVTRISPPLNASNTSNISNVNHKRINDVPQSNGLTNDFKKLHLNIAQNDGSLVNPFSPNEPTPSPVSSDDIGMPLINNDDNKHEKHKKLDIHSIKRLSLRAGHFRHNSKDKDKGNAVNEENEPIKEVDDHLLQNYTLSPENIQPNPSEPMLPPRPVPAPKPSNISGISNSLRQNLQMPVLEPSPASKLRAATLKRTTAPPLVQPVQPSQYIQSSYPSQQPQQPQQPQQFQQPQQPQQPPPLPERPNMNQIHISGIHASNTISVNSSTGDKLASRRAVINVDVSKANRAPPYADGYSKIELSAKHPKCMGFCNQSLFIGSSNLSVYNTKTGMPSNMVAIDEKIKITSILLVPGQYLVDEGNIVWVGCDKGIIYEIDINTSRINQTHVLSSVPVIGMYYSNNKIWAVSEKNVAVWTRHEATNDFKLSHQPTVEFNLNDVPEYKIAYILNDKLWLCGEKTITVLGPYPHFASKKTTNLKALMGKITCIAEAGLNSNEIFTGHDDGKITIWDSENVTIKETFSVSYYNITSILTVNDKHVWVGLSTGKICVFDTNVKPWKKIKDFEAHFHSGVIQLIRDPFYPYALVPPYTSVANSTLSVVASLSEDGFVHFWDAFLSNDYINDLIKDQETYFSERNDLTVFITTYNCDSTKPQELIADDFNKKFFDNWFKIIDSPDIVVVGLQEMVNLESKTVNAKSFFKKAKKKSKKDKLDNRQQLWVDAITANLLNSQKLQYTNISCTQMVGLFLAIFVKPEIKNRISCLHVDTVETGLKGYHGNKGSIALRMLIDDSSVCIINTHLAAHQDQVVARNNDVVTIMNETKFPPHDKACCYINGGDGSQIMDYENVFWFGDMNYRIDPVNNLTREDIVRMAMEGKYDELIKMDQFHNIHSTDKGFPLYPLTEGKINFAPTFKYDIGYNHYDTSEKQRIPSWCDRILYRGTIQQLNYQRHECTASDHRPVSSSFRVSIKKINLNKYQQVI